MNLPDEIWINILKNINDLSASKNLYISLPKITQEIINPEYIKHLESFEEHICVCLQNRVIVFRKNIKINYFFHEENIYYVKFIPDTTKIILSTSNGKIIIWNYITNQSEQIFNSTGKVCFQLSPCSRYLAIFKNYSPNNLIYLYNLNNKKITNFFINYMSEDTNIQILFNPVKTEMTILSYYFNEFAVSNHSLEIIDYESMTSLFFTNEEYYKSFYDNYGNLYCLMYRKGIFLFDENKFTKILNYLGFIIDFHIENHLIYFCDSCRNMDRSNVVKYNLETKKINSLYYTDKTIKKIKLSKDKDKLIFKTNQKIIFLKLKEEKIKNGLFDNKVYLEENYLINDTEEFPDIEDFDIKNYYKKLMVKYPN